MQPARQTRTASARRGMISCGATLLFLVACNVYDDSLLTPAKNIPGTGNGSGGGGSNTGGGNTGGIPVSGGAGGAPNTGGTSTSGGTGGSATGGTGTGGSAGDVATSGGTSGSTSGSSGVGGSAGTGVITPPEGTELIEDMEDGNREIKKTSGRRGAWYLSHEAATGATQTPDPKAPLFMTNMTRDSSTRAFNTIAKKSGWALAGFDLNYDGLTRAAYNASNYVGIKFFARVDATSIKDVRVQFLDKTTDPAGGVCDPAPGAAVDAQCLAHFGSDLTFTSEWKQYDVLFALLDQPGWGKHADSLDSAHLYGIQFSWSDPDPTNSQGMNLWIDDIYFYVKP